MNNEYCIDAENSANDIAINEHRIDLLGRRLGESLVRRRLGLERDRESWLLGQASSHSVLENWRPVRGLIRSVFRVAKLLDRARQNALSIELREHEFVVSSLPPEFDGFRILHLSDLHLDMNESFPDALSERVRNIDYDLCVITGDFRFETYGPIERAVEGMRKVRQHLGDEVYAILGNHDSIHMVPEFEALGIKMLVNESVVIHRGKAQVQLAGIDDAHYYKTHNFDAVCRSMHEARMSILLAHTPEVYAQAAYSGFNLMFCGHTHGGQICLPGGIPLITEASCPRRYCRGPWQYYRLQGYTSSGAGSSIVDLRLNCPPEVTVHTLRQRKPAVVVKLRG